MRSKYALFVQEEKESVAFFFKICIHLKVREKEREIEKERVLHFLPTRMQ